MNKIKYYNKIKLIFFYHSFPVKQTEVDKLEDSNCLMVFVLTYGLSDRTIMAHDKSYDYMEIVKEFYSDKLKALANKPKFFFIQTASVSNIQNITLESCTPPSDIEPDILIGYNSGKLINFIYKFNINLIK